MSENGRPPERILVVDDDRAIRELLRRLLTHAGYDCATAASGAEADEQLARERFELLLVDLQMPGESGLDVIGHVQRTHPETAAIMITGVDDPALAEAALSIGAYGYVVKPFSPTELSIQVMNALRRRKLELAQRYERERLEQTVAERTRELRSAVERLARAQNETVLRLAAAVEARDQETAEHIERVAEWSALVGARLGLPQTHCELLRSASSLHDIGKIGVRDEILLKPGWLTAAEREEIERHTQVGYEMLAGSEVDVLELAARVALTHMSASTAPGTRRACPGLRSRSRDASSPSSTSTTRSRATGRTVPPSPTTRH